MLMSIDLFVRYPKYGLISFGAFLRKYAPKPNIKSGITDTTNNI